MKTAILQPSKTLLPYVSSIVVMESNDKNAETRLPFYADGCPGIMFSQTDNDLVLEPHHLVLDELILYGQTITPIELCLKGRFRLVVFILYPFVPKALFDIDPAEINDTCTNLASKAKTLPAALKKLKNTSEQVKQLDAFLADKITRQKPQVDPVINKAIKKIIDTKGTGTIKAVRESLHITERTFERYFISHIGISPKRFAQIIQFQASLSQLTSEQQHRLSDIVYENGFADQSHFIRTFRKFSGKTPKHFKK